MLSCLVIFTATFFVLTLYAILQANQNLLPIAVTRFFSFKILDASSAATLLVSLIGALLVRHQFALGLLPRINYKSTIFTTNDARNPMVSYETWRVEIRNSGLGPAIINRVEYLLELPDAKGFCYKGTHQTIIKELTKVGFVYEHDYWLENIATGFALSPKDDSLAFEIKVEHIEKLKRLDMVIFFQSQLGGQYWREVFFIPPGSRKTDK